MRSHNIKHRLTRGSSKVSPLHCLLICGALCHGAWLGWCGVGTDSGQRSGELTPVSGLLCIIPNPELDAANFQRSRQQRLRTKADFPTESRTFCSGQVVSNFLSLSRHPDQACISYISPCELVQYIHIVHWQYSVISDITVADAIFTHISPPSTKSSTDFSAADYCLLVCVSRSSNTRLETGWVLFQFIKRRQFYIYL